MVPPVIVSCGHFDRLHWRLRARLPMWVVFQPGTVEYPREWVARMNVVLPDPKPTRFVITHDTLAGLRSSLPQGLSRLARDPADEPLIFEVWL